MKIQSISLTPVWGEPDKFTGRATLVAGDDTQISLVLAPEVTAKLIDTVTKHVKTQAQTRSVEFFNGMQNVGLPALEHQA